MRHKVSNQVWDSICSIDKTKLCEDIAFFENKLEQVGCPGNDLYKNAMVNAFKGLIVANKQQLSKISSIVAN
ncbi:MAG: hypothetical protein D6B28_03370 [Gammaproteobacteria bacterium]|nr:MAG: hypothetical protein D6B28_03370 [Gammaproteobacteria bacterium]